MATREIVVPDAEGFLPNGWVDPYPHREESGGCYGQCCVPEAYPNPGVWCCVNPQCRENNNSKFYAKLRSPGECINCCPPLTAAITPTT